MKLICAIFPNLERIIIPNLPKKLISFACGTNFVRTILVFFKYLMRIRKATIFYNFRYFAYLWKHSTIHFASLSLLYQFKCGKKFIFSPFSCLNAINYIYSLAAGINVFTEKRNGLLRQSFLLFPLWQTAVFGRFTSPGIDQTAVQWDQILFKVAI